MGLFGFSLIRLFVKVINVPKKYLMPIIFVLTFVGSYAYNNSIIDVFVMVFFGFLGYFINKMEFSMSSVVIGIILGSMAEANFRGSLMMSDGSLSIFVTHPICAVFLVIALISLCSPILGPAFKKLRNKKKA
jgi:putative tricarboxylic transport membrane protein